MADIDLESIPEEDRYREASFNEEEEEDEDDGGMEGGRALRDGLIYHSRRRAWCSGLSVVITGGCGFLGLHVARLLYNESNEVYITLMDKEPIRNDVMRFITGTVGNGHRVQYCHGNVLVRADLKRVFEDANVVIHCAVKGDSIMDNDSCKETEHVNVTGTENVVQACVACKVQALVFVGSIFQVLRDGVKNQEGICEKPSFEPRITDELVLDTYGHSKNEAEKMVLSANGAGEGTLHTCSIRCPPLYGENDTSLIPSVAWASKVSSRLIGYYPRIGSPNVKMTAMYVENAAHALLCAAKKLMDKKSKGIVGGNYYYVTDDTPHTNYSDFFGRFLSRLDYNVKLGVRIPVLVISFWLYLILVGLIFLMIFFDFRNIAGLVLKYQHQVKILSISHTVSRDKAARELQYRPIVTPDLAFQKCIGYYVKTCRHSK